MLASFEDCFHDGGREEGTPEDLLPSLKRIIHALGILTRFTWLNTLRHESLRRVCRRPRLTNNIHLFVRREKLSFVPSAPVSVGFSPSFVRSEVCF
jgi:hypothetical protein